MSATDLDRYLTDEMIERARRVLVDEGADSEGGWHSWRCFDRERYPEPCGCTAEIARAALSAVLPDIIQQAKAEALDERAVKLAETSIHTSHATGQALSRCVDLVEHIAKDEVIREAKAEALREAADQLDAYSPRDNPAPADPRWTCDLGYYGEAAWLRVRADRIEQGGKP